MPEQSRSGQRDPVRGEPLQTQEVTGVAQQYDDTDDDVESSSPSSLQPTRSTAASALAIAHNRYHQHHHHHHQQAIRLVPVSSTSNDLDGSRHLPPSPPSTPSISPPDHPHFSESWSPEDRGESSWLAAKEREYVQAPTSITIRKEDIPDTPDASPSTVGSVDGRVPHQLSVSAHDFVKSVLPNVISISAKTKDGPSPHAATGRGQYIIEDAGMELICTGWAGAVLIYTGPPSYPSFMPIASSPRARYGSSMRMSLSSSTSSSSAGLDRPVPRRTLLARIGFGDISDDKDLRGHILDVLDHATEKLHVENVIFVLDRTGLEEERFRATVHGLCYVGANIIGHGPHDAATSEERSQYVHGAPVEGGDVEENIHAPRCVARNLVLLSVDV